MGQKSSRLKVTAELTVVGSASTVDTIRLDSYRSTCCGGKWKKIAAFTFPRKGWSSGDLKKNSSSNVAKVPFEKLRKKDGDTPVRMSCLVAGVSVLSTVTTLSDLLRMLELTKQGNKAVLLFSLEGREVQASEPRNMILRLRSATESGCGGNGVPHAVDTSGRCDQEEIPSVHESGTEGDQVSLAEDVPQRVAEERTAGPQSDHDQDDVMFEELIEENVPVAKEGTACRRRRKNTSKAVKSPAWSSKHEEDPVAQEEEEKCHQDYCSPQEKPRKSFRMESVPARHTGGNNHRGRPPPGYKGSRFWDHVSVFAGVVALGLIVYNAWQEYLKHGV